MNIEIKFIPLKAMKKSPTVKKTIEEIQQVPSSVFCAVRKIGDTYFFVFCDDLLCTTESFSSKNYISEEELMKKLDPQEILLCEVKKNSRKFTVKGYDKYGYVFNKKTFKNYHALVISPSVLQFNFLGTFRPYKIKIEKKKNGSLVHYYGRYKKMFSKSFPTKMKISDEIFDDDRIDYLWCLSNIDDIKSNSNKFKIFTN